MPVNFLKFNPAVNAANPFQVNRQQPDSNFVKNSFNFENANPNRPESRDDIHGKKLYCLA